MWKPSAADLYGQEDKFFCLVETGGRIIVRRRTLEGKDYVSIRGA